MIRLMLASALVSFACVRAIPPPPPPDRDGSGTRLGFACVALRRLSCPEGQPLPVTGRTCFESLTVMETLTPFPDDCVTAAYTTEDVRACGVRCRK